MCSGRLAWQIAECKVSILIPVYNEGDLIAAAVSRVLAVDFGEGVETEIVIVDDGSTDGSKEAAAELCELLPGQTQADRTRRESRQGSGHPNRDRERHGRHRGDSG